MHPKISVIIPVYNAEKYLQNCLDSILKQSYKNIEIICVNDGSIDNSQNILNKYARQDKRLISIEKENGGVSIARNNGISMASGEYIAFVDSDDYIESNYIEELYLSIVSNKADLAICKVNNFGCLNRVDKLSYNYMELNENYEDEWEEINRNFLLYGPCNKLYKTTIIKKNDILFPKDITYGEDLLFNFHYLEYIKNISFTNQTTYFYRKDSPDSLSKVYRDDRFENEIILAESMKKFMIKKNLYNNNMKLYLQTRILDCAYNHIFEIIKFEKKNKQREMIKKILKNNILKDCYDKQVVNGYSKFVVFFMKHKCYMLIKVWILLRC